MPLYQNIFDDFDSIMEVYNKYHLEDIDYDQAKMICTIINSSNRVQLI